MSDWWVSMNQEMKTMDGPKADALLAAIVESSDDAIISLTLDGVITSWNQAAERMFGYTAAEVAGRPVAELIPADRAGAEAEILNRVRHGERVDHFLAVGRRKDGTPVNLSLTVSPLRDESGRIVGASRIARDITGQLAAEQSLRYAAAIVESSEDAIISKDLNGIITSWNASAERIYGYTAGEAIGKSILMMIPPERHAEEAQILSRLVAGERIEHFETIRVGKNGRVIQISLTISPIRDAEGRIIGASKIARDITDRIENELALAEAQRKLRAYAGDLEKKVQERTAKLQDMITELEGFSYTVSHDLRAPVRAMQQYAEAIIEDYGAKLDDTGRRLLGRIVNAGTKLDALIRDVLRYSRVVRANVEFHPVDLEAVVRDVTSQQPELQSPRAELEIRGPLLPVLGHEVFLTQCLANLLGNAVKFVPPGRVPKIVIRTEERGDNVRLWVEDNGIGIAPQYQARIFGMFERIIGDQHYEGTGIGLTIVKKAVERMGGAVGVESQAGQGSRFWIELHDARRTPSSGDLGNEFAGEES